MRHFNTQKANYIHSLQPKIHQHDELKVCVCPKCKYVNSSEYLFCTYCGFPLNKNEQMLTVYNLRRRQRKELLSKSEAEINYARIALYVMAVFSLAGFGFFFSQLDKRYAYTIVSLMLSALFFTLAHWSRKNPFSAMLMSFIVMMTFSTINIFGKITESFTTAQGVYGIMICMLLLFFLLRGMQGAYKADLIKEELQINKSE